MKYYILLILITFSIKSYSQGIYARSFISKTPVFYNVSTKYFQISGDTQKLDATFTFSEYNNEIGFRLAEVISDRPKDYFYKFIEKVKNSERIKLLIDNETWFVEFKKTGMYLFNKNNAGFFYSSNDNGMDSLNSSTFITGNGNSYSLDSNLNIISSKTSSYVTHDVKKVQEDSDLLLKFPDFKTNITENGNYIFFISNGLETQSLKTDRNYFYSSDLELIDYKAECPSCKNSVSYKWDIFPGLLKFTCIETSKVLIKLTFKKKECPDNIIINSSSNVNNIIKDKIKVNSSKMIITLSDNASVDGDIISLKINDEIFVKNLLLNKCKSSFEVNLNSGENKICLIAENIGNIPPNTAKLSIESSNNFRKEIILKADKNYSECIIINAD